MSVYAITTFESINLDDYPRDNDVYVFANSLYGDIAITLGTVNQEKSTIVVKSSVENDVTIVGEATNVISLQGTQQESSLAYFTSDFRGVGHYNIYQYTGNSCENLGANPTYTTSVYIADYDAWNYYSFNQCIQYGTIYKVWKTYGIVYETIELAVAGRASESGSLIEMSYSIVPTEFEIPFIDSDMCGYYNITFEQYNNIDGSGEPFYSTTTTTMYIDSQLSYNLISNGCYFIEVPLLNKCTYMEIIDGPYESL